MGDCISRALLLDLLYERFSIGPTTQWHNWTGVPEDEWRRQCDEARKARAILDRQYRAIVQTITDLPAYTGHELDQEPS